MDEVERKEQGSQSYDLPRLEILNLLMRGKREPSFDFKEELFKVMEEYANMPSSNKRFIVEQLYKKEFMRPYQPMMDIFCEMARRIEDGDLMAADLLNEIVEKNQKSLKEICNETTKEIDRRLNGDIDCDR